jgi:hypothetical protein
MADMVQDPSPLTEHAIRTALVSRLRAHAQRRDLIVEELGVGTARVDLAWINDHLMGFEIKSDFDTLDRLARQMHAYHSVFDTLTIVTTAAYVHQVEALLPHWWGIWQADADGHGHIVLHERRLATKHDRQNPASLAAMLWRDEAYAFVVEQLGPVVRARATRGELQEIMASQIPLASIHERVLTALRQRDVLKPRSHVASEQLSDGEHHVVIRRVTAPRREIAG